MDDKQSLKEVLSESRDLFLLHDAMLAWYMLLSCVCLFVRPSFTNQHCTKWLNTESRK